MDRARPARAATRAPRPAGDRELPARIRAARGLLVVESYFGGWEKPWRSLSAEAWAELLAALGPDAEGISVETGANRAFARRHGLEIVPAVLVFLGGEVVARFTGTLAPATVAAEARAAVEHASELRTDALALESASAGAPIPSVLRRRAATGLAHAG